MARNPTEGRRVTKKEALENIKEAIQLVLEVTQAQSYTEVVKVEVASA